MSAERSVAAASLKPREVEELVDFYVHRRLALALVAVVRGTPITPNQITVVSGLLGVAAGCVIGCASPATPGLPPLAGLLLLASVVCDCADGQLARLRGTSTLVGRALDGIVDAFPIIAVQVGFAVFLIRAGVSPWYVVTVLLLVLLAWRWHAELYDRAKCLYLANTRDEPGSEGVSDLDEIRAERDALRAEGRKGSAWCLAVLLHYTAHQRRHGDRAGYDRPAMPGGREREAYRRIYGPAMRVWSWTGIGTHHFLMMLAAALTPFHSAAALVAWWIIIGPMSLLTFTLERSTPRMEKRLNEALSATGSVGKNGGEA